MKIADPRSSSRRSSGRRGSRRPTRSRASSARSSSRGSPTRSPSRRSPRSTSRRVRRALRVRKQKLGPEFAASASSSRASSSRTSRCPRRSSRDRPADEARRPRRPDGAVHAAAGGRGDQVAAANPGGIAGAGVGSAPAMAMGGRWARRSAGSAAPPAPAAPPPPPARRPRPRRAALVLAIDGKTYGPYTDEALRGMVARGPGGPWTLAWHPGAAGWAPLQTFEGSPARRPRRRPPVPPPPPPPAEPALPDRRGRGTPLRRSSEIPVRGLRRDVVWNPGAASKCPYCGGRTALPPDTAEAPEQPIEEALRAPRDLGWGGRAKASRARCGATTTSSPGVAASPARSAARPRSSRPADREHGAPRRPPPVPGRPTAPPGSSARGSEASGSGRTISSRNRPSPEVQGVYVPFWTFDARRKRRWTAEAGYDYQVAVSGRGERPDGDADRDPHAVGAGLGFLEKLSTTCLSRRRRVCRPTSPLDRAVPDRRARPYEPSYLSGFLAEEYAVGVGGGLQIAAKARMSRRSMRPAPRGPGRHASGTCTVRTLVRR